MNVTKQYQANLDVSCGDEGEDGALLFNPDTNDSVIINPSGLGIWEFINTPRTLEQIMLYMTELYQGITPEAVVDDLTQFLEALQPDFIQEVELSS